MNFHTTPTGEKKEKRVEYFVTNAIKLFNQKTLFFKRKENLGFLKKCCHFFVYFLSLGAVCYYLERTLKRFLKIVVKNC